MNPALPDKPQDEGEDEAASRRLRLFRIRDLATVEYEHRQPEPARVAVVIPLYNYRQTIAECLASVVAQDLRPLSVVVVDDASSDQGGATATAFLRGHSDCFAHALVIRHRRNQGLAMARNSGIAWTAEPYLFMLDADNRIKPPCLSRLVEALETSGAAFAYPQLHMFGETEGVGLADVWDPRRLRLGNYIDAMALLRREVLIAAGGYATLANEYGWEDYDLWCRLAELDYRGIFLPEILGEYRVQSSSMLRAKTAKYLGPLAAELTLRHPAIFLGGEPDKSADR